MPHDALPSTRSAGAVLRLAGGEALDLIHRVSTQRLSDLTPGRCRPTLFCDFRGRLLHRVVVAVTSDGATWLVRDDAPAAPLVEFLERQIFREKITIVDRSAGFTVAATTARVARSTPPDTTGAAAETIIERDGRPVELVPDARTRYVIAGDEGAGNGSEADRERARIHAGRPRHGYEIDEAFNPYEVGLAHEVHLDKGCFTGQEALLRMMTYGAVRRALHALVGDGAPPAVPATVLRNGDKAGVVTSAAGDAGGWIGLAVMRPELVSPGLVTADGVTITRCVAFPSTRPLGLPETTV